ncbi:Molybdenum cofactor carrier [Planctomycetales bacterium 10988]|nr:Molybdenum cofactor carrier [Planctomycetales bacterium 10988]
MQTRMLSSSSTLVRIVSGGQTGVDRGALDAALRWGLPHGGWCPRGRLAEDGTIPPFYQLMETPEVEAAERTWCNVRDSDATLIFTRGPLSGGTALTATFALQERKPLFIFPLRSGARPSGSELHHLRGWLVRKHIHVLNIAGPRESQAPGIHQQVHDSLLAWFAMLAVEISPQSSS